MKRKRKNLMAMMTTMMMMRKIRETKAKISKLSLILFLNQHILADPSTERQSRAREIKNLEKSQVRRKFRRHLQLKKQQRRKRRRRVLNDDE